MRYFSFLNTTKAYFVSDPMVTQVTQGSIDDIDLDRMTLGTLVHIQINSATPSSNTVTFNCTVFCMDIVDISKTETTDFFMGNDNEIDTLDTTLDILLRFDAVMRRGDLFDANFQLEEGYEIEPFTERFENNWAGWAMTYDVTVANIMSSCDGQG